jgi:hypothetical protein
MNYRCVFSLTTIPSRIKSLAPTLKSLLQQTIPANNIYLTIPRKCKRLNTIYPAMPKCITDICEIVYIDKDYGPITKLLGGLIREDDPNTLIITVDDDIIYPPNMIEVFLKYHQQHPNSALCSAGLILGNKIFRYSIKFNQAKNNYWFTMSVPKKGRPVDIIYGYSGALYKRSFFPSYDKFKSNVLSKLNNIDLYRNDDIVISFYLNREKVERRIIKMPEVTSNSGDDALSGDPFKFFQSLRRSVKLCENMNWVRKYEKVYMTETFTCVGLAILTLIVLLMIILINVFNHCIEF